MRPEETFEGRALIGEQEYMDSLPQGPDKSAGAIPASEWKWFGHAAHFICGRWCRFHLATQIGGFIVSTVGEYLPPESSREYTAARKGIPITGRGEQAEAEYIRKVGYEEIGYGRKFETMVFRAGKPCSAPGCSCGLPELSPPNELDFEGYNTPGEAAAGHARLCQTVASVEWRSALIVREAQAEGRS